MRRHVDSIGGVEQHRVVEANVPAVRRDQPGNHADERRLSRARSAEHTRYSARRLVPRGKGSRHQPFLPAERAHAHSPWKRGPARRASHSATTKTASEIAIATSTRRPAAASPPGIWVKV